jgi:hypothetical protein
MNQTVRERGRTATSVTISGTANTYVLNELGLSLNNFGTRSLALGDIFGEWKLVKLSITMASPGTVVNTATQAVSYIGNAVGGVYYTALTPSEYSAPTTVATTVDFPLFSWGNSLEKISLVVHGKDVTTPTPWLLTNATGVTDSFSTLAGTVGLWTLSGASSGAQGSFVAIFDWVIDFKGPMDPATLPKVPRPLTVFEDSVKVVREEKSDGYDDEVVEVTSVRGYPLRPTPSSISRVNEKALAVPVLRRGFREESKERL